MHDEPREPNDLSLGFSEAMYAEYLRDPRAVPDGWRRWFASLGPAPAGFTLTAPSWGDARCPSPVADRSGAATGATDAALREARLAARQNKVDQLIRNYRVRGHRMAQLDPLGQPRPAAARARPGLLRLHRGRPGRVLRGRLAAPGRAAHAARDHRAAAQHLLPLHRRAVHAHRRPGRARVAAGADGEHARTASTLAPRGAAAHPHPADRRRDLRGVHPEEVRRRQDASRWKAARA